MKRLDEATAFAESLNLGEAARKSRFSAYRARLTTLSDSLEQGGHDAARTAFLADLERNAVALVESQELGTILPFLTSLSNEAVRKKLQIVFQGPEVPSDESASSNHARNTMVELNLAARLHRAGLEVKIGEEADLVFDHGPIRWFGECKRPFKVESIENNLKDGCSQIGKRLAGYRLAAKGVLAISLSRPISTRAPILEFTDAQELRQLFRQHLGEMVTLIQTRMSEFSQCRSVGGIDLLVAQLGLAAWNAREALPTGIQHAMLADISRDGRGDAKRLWSVLAPTFDG